MTPEERKKTHLRLEQKKGESLWKRMGGFRYKKVTLGVKREEYRVNEKGYQ